MVYAAIRFDDENVFAPAKYQNLGILLNQILPILMSGAAVLFLVICLRAAFAILTNGENPEAIKKAQQTLGYAILGLFLVVLSFLLVKLIGRVLQIDTILPT
ncbi:MAG: hypothetical protein US11_C0006G0008 [Candidatus Roizmanbacteria bacterium GW2011_GWA2_36_23]|uniref:Uncharacterized protein n=1 Tax=Candidatus Roizmanbacteria bacterium GW2011_GWA2_36_23 TaxID=1618480 RepID=A0A0G0HCB8_9BACT|nr:MAG: hypothetical protein US11_C0006G0008 [Candidatus Roizmanbacteria bacterium GW2011_GWA2_36_23]